MEAGKYSLLRKYETKNGVEYSSDGSYAKIEGAGRNISLIILWVVAIIIGIIIIISSVSYVIIISVNSGDPDILNGTTYCKDLTSQLQDISDQPFCKDMGNIKYNKDLLVNSGPSEISYQNVCRQFCPVGMYNTTNDTCTCDDPDIAERVDNCVNASKPVGCVGQAKPISISNGTVYYAQNANLIGCVPSENN